MSTLERLQKDSAELEMFVEKLAEEGKSDLVKKIRAKKKFLDDKVKQLIQDKAA
jgi:hypothetical protein